MRPLLLFSLLFLLACGNGPKKQKLNFYSSDNIPETQTAATTLPEPEPEESHIPQTDTENLIAVDFFEKGNGVKYLNVEINGLPVEMIFDTGCSRNLISPNEIIALYEQGKLQDKDFIGFAPSQIADGSTTVDAVIRFSEVIIDEQITFNDVLFHVSDNYEAPLLLGNEILDRVASYKIDNETQTIYFKPKAQ